MRKKMHTAAECAHHAEEDESKGRMSPKYFRNYGYGIADLDLKSVADSGG